MRIYQHWIFAWVEGQRWWRVKPWTYKRDEFPRFPRVIGIDIGKARVAWFPPWGRIKY
jgi:hypothetical protein